MFLKYATILNLDKISILLQLSDNLNFSLPKVDIYFSQN